MDTLYSVKETAEKLGLSEKTVLANIKNGKIPGRKVGGRYFAEKQWVDDLAEKAPVEPKDTKSTQEQKQRQHEVDLIEYETKKIAAETSKIQAEILLAEAKRERDRPERLIEREEAVRQRENELNQRELSIIQKETASKERLDNNQRIEIELRGRIQEVNDECEEIKQEADDYIHELEVKLVELDNEIKQRQYLLSSLEVKVEEEVQVNNSKVFECQENCQLWINHTLKHASRYARLGEKGNGASADRYITLANSLWVSYESFQSIMKWLSQEVEQPSMSVEDVEKEYEKQSNPIITKVNKLTGRRNGSEGFR